MYETLLYLHSWLRWLVLLAAGVAFVRAVMALQSKRAWEPLDRKVQLGFVLGLDLQAALGLGLYLVSPLTQFANLKSSMKVAALRFFAVEHVFVMVLALAVVHILSAKSKRSTDGVKKLRLWSWGVVVGVLLLLAAIPWPGLAHGRMLFRLP